MSWLDDYCAWAVDCTDAPAIFHQWGAYMALSSALGRRVTFTFGPWEVPPNLYVLLLAPSSIFRKSTALNLSRRIAGKVGAYTLAGDGSPEGFIEDLKEHPQGSLYFSELSSLLTQFDREYAAALRPLLTDLYDAPSTYRRKLRSTEINIINPCVNLFAASTLHWVLDKVRQSDFGGGFLTRFILVNAIRKEKHYAIPPPADVLAENRLVSSLKELTSFCKGEVSLDPIRTPFERWSAGFDKRAKSPLLAAFIARLQIGALKLAILEQISESASTILTPDALERATAAIEGVADATAALEEQELGYGQDRDGQDQRLVARIIREAGSIGWTGLLRKSHLASKRLAAATGTLQASKQIEIKKQEITRPQGGGNSIRIVQWRGNGDELI